MLPINIYIAKYEEVAYKGLTFLREMNFVNV
jgi:hypothetical protein